MSYNTIYTNNTDHLVDRHGPPVVLGLGFINTFQSADYSD
jgi:hypothetical protein